jgi:exosortase
MIWKAKQPLLWLISTFIALIIALGSLYGERLQELHTHWTTPDDLDLGYILLVAFLYFSFQNHRKEISPPNLYLLPFIAILSCLFFASELMDLKTLFFLCLALSFPLFVATIFGVRNTLRLIIPWSILLMAMPFWYIAIPILQSLTVKVVSSLASAISLTVLVEGNYFTLTSGVVHVAGGCSGLKYFMSSITIALISSAISKRNIRLSLLSAITAVILAIIGNWIRVFILLLVAYYEGVGHPLVADHDSLGWVIFAIVMLPWFFIDRWFDKPNTSLLSKQENENNENTPSKAKEHKQINSKKTAIAFASCFILFIGLQFLIQPPISDSKNLTFIELPITLNGMNLLSTKSTEWKPDFPTPSASSYGKYFQSSEVIDAAVLNYQFDSEAEMANHTNKIFEEAIWRIISDTPWQSKQDSEIKIRIALAKSGQQYRAAYYWYKHGNKFANSVFPSKILQVKDLYKGLVNSQLMALSFVCDNQCQINPAPSEKLEQLIFQFHSTLILNDSVETDNKIEQ